MRRGDFYDYEQEPLVEQEEKKEEAKQWNLFKNEPRKAEGGSTADNKHIEQLIKLLKIGTILFTFLVVLGTAVVSKGSILFMAAQIGKNVTRAYCNKNIDSRQQFVVSLPEEERASWIWMIMFAYFIPELGTWFRSVRILLFKSWDFPTFWDFFWLCLTESFAAIGSSILIFVVYPELDVIKAAMLTNAVCFIPALVVFFSRSPGRVNGTLKMLLDVLAIVAQGTSFIAWPLVEGKPILYAIPAAVLMISFGWWENFVSDKSPIGFVSDLAKSKREFQNRTYFSYSILAPLKCILFFSTAVIYIWVQEGSVDFMFSKFGQAFQSHELHVVEIEPMLTSNDFSIEDAVITGMGTTIQTSLWTPLNVLFVNIICTYVCYAFAKFACKIMIQTSSFAFPINLSVPVLLTALIAICGNYSKDPCAYSSVVPSYLFFNVPSMTYLKDFISHQHSYIWLVWLLSQTWITIHIWNENEEKLASTEKLFLKPMYDAFLIDQSIAMNRRRVPPSRKKLATEHEEEEKEKEVIDPNKDNITRIYACGTMWHETKEEMVAFLKSIFRLDEDQCAHRIVRTYLQYNLPNYYELETHILFDDAFIRVSKKDTDPRLNSYVLDLIESVSVAASEVHATNIRIKPPLVYSTPYGGRLVWTLPGKTKMVAHLKDAVKVRAKKRWSQCMYMYYLLGFRIMDNDQLPEERIKRISENTYLLALDGDIDFQPQSVHLLVDYMKKNRSLGAACGRIHPVGSGAMAWYQIFEYAVGHWLQKATEHVIGCVLCSPGCFSLFRACALMDDNVMAKYTTVSEEALHYVQYDQGEDRWLCTLLLQRGYRVEYSAASDSYTHCPEGFNEFYNQRRRWMPSTTANIMDLLTDYKHIVKINDNISQLYMVYQFILMLGTVIGPGSIFLMLVGAFVAAFKLDQWTSFIWNILPILIFVVCCATTKADTQLFMAGVISAIYGLVMMAVLIGIFMQIKDDGILAPSSLFFLVMAGEFIVTALLHPQEIYCLKYGVIYYVTVPSMYMLLVIYSIFNMNNVSWGTRDVTVVEEEDESEEEEEEKTEEEKKKEEEKKRGEANKAYSFFGNSKDNAGSFEFSFSSLFKVMCCTYDNTGRENEMLRNIQDSLKEVHNRLNQIERNQFDPQPAEPRKTRAPTIRIEGSRASRLEAITNSDPFTRKSVIGQIVENNFADEKEEELYVGFSSDDVPENSWFYHGELINSEVAFLDKKEKKFWEEFIGKYLTPIKESKKKKGKLSKDLKDLRDKMVLTFFMINSLFVLVIFLLTLQKDILHLNWPIDPKVNFTYGLDQNQILIQHTYLELEPIGFVFLIFFALLMVVQFFAMIIHRFGTYCQIMSNTVLNFNLFDSGGMRHLTEEKILKRDPIRIIKKLIKLQGINDDAEEDRDAPVTRRNTAHFLALKKKKKAKPVIEELDKAFFARLEKINNGEIKEQDLKLPRKSLAAINNRRDMIHRRKSQMPGLNAARPSGLPVLNDFPVESRMVFDNEAYEDEDFA